MDFAPENQGQLNPAMFPSEGVTDAHEVGNRLTMRTDLVAGMCGPFQEQVTAKPSSGKPGKMKNLWGAEITTRALEPPDITTGAHLSFLKTVV